ncbi:MAG: HAMP domain-containing histidine kinase [Flavobacteriales bacterium]|nr:HAMP domain-containing histidine kinase [Flavobacteriales bacterium]
MNKLVNDDENVIHSKTMMIAGEAAVFITLLFAGVYFIRRSILKELALVHEKKNFSLSVTHELKTPIASTKLFVETLINRDLPREKEKDILKKVYADQNRLQQLVEDILLVSKIEESTLKIRLSKINVKVFIEQIIYNMVGENPITVAIDPALTMHVDEFYFSSVIQNLQSNAVKYSEKNSPIVWSARRKGNRIVIQIQDEGKGIEDSEKLNIFKLFYRSGNEETRKTKGTGIGLYLVARIIKLHKGKIKALDNKPQGTIIEIEL